MCIRDRYMAAPVAGQSIMVRRSMYCAISLEAMQDLTVTVMWYGLMQNYLSRRQRYQIMNRTAVICRDVYKRQVMEVNTGTVLYEKNSHEKHYPASITKILTTYLKIGRAHV